MIAFNHFLSSSLSSYSERLESIVLLSYVHFLFTATTLLRWWRSVSTLIRIFQNIVDHNSLICSWNARNSLSSIMLCLKNDRFRQLYTAIFHSDHDDLRCHRFHISSRSVRQSLLTMTMIVSLQWENWLRLFVAEKYEMCRVSSLIEISLIDKHLLWSFLSYMIRFIYDSIFSMIVQS